VALALNITNLSEFRTWMAAASHGNEVKGITRMLFGFARSFIHMGNDGILFKRYLVGDKYNPTTLSQLIQMSIWKFALFYTSLACICFNLLRSPNGRRVLFLLVSGSIPVIIFATLFDGGAIERYLPLYPFLFIALSASFVTPKAVSPLRWLIGLFCVAVIGVNASAMSANVVARQEQAAATRIGYLQERIKPGSRIVAVNWQDPLVNFNRSFPLHPINRTGEFRIGSLVTPGTANVSNWREEFAALALRSWDNGGEVWISERVTVARPLPEWNWVEGDDPRVSWNDFFLFFKNLEMSGLSGDPDRFALIVPSARNKAVLGALHQQK
jgi:hypothetical protein